jgi:hypothetical protein
MKLQRQSLGVGSATHRPTAEDTAGKSKSKRTSFLTVQSKTDQALLDRPRLNSSSSRVHTESGPLVICKRLYTDFIMETDEEECF